MKTDGIINLDAVQTVDLPKIPQKKIRCVYSIDAEEIEGAVLFIDVLIFHVVNLEGRSACWNASDLAAFLDM